MKINIASVQMTCALGDKATNLERITGYIRSVKRLHPETDLVLFSECALSGYECPELYRSMAEEYPNGASIRAICGAARDAGVYVVFGFIEKSGERIYNSAAIIDRQGMPIGIHRKAHLVEGMETDSFAMGDDFTVYDTPIGRLGIMICWDAAFPECARMLALKGAELILVPEAVEKGIERQWELALRARAFDNGAYLLSCNHVGMDRTLEYFGMSSLIAPDGETAAMLDGEEAVLYACIDLDRVRETREYFYMLRQRRPEIYSCLSTVNQK